MELPPTGSYPINGAGLAHHQLSLAPDPWRLPPKQIQQRLGPSLPPRDWIELRNSDSPAKQKPEMANGTNSVSGRISDSRPPPPPPPTSAPLPVPPQPPPKKILPNTGLAKSAPPPPTLNSASNSRVETMSRNKVLSGKPLTLLKVDLCQLFRGTTDKFKMKSSRAKRATELRVISKSK